MDIMSCNSCRFVSELPSMQPGWTPETGLCHRYPPTVMKRPPAQYPLVNLKHDWCGEHQLPRIGHEPKPSADSIGNESTSYAKGE